MRAFCQDQQHGTPGKSEANGGVVDRGKSEANGGQMITAPARPERLKRSVKSGGKAVIMRSE